MDGLGVLPKYVSGAFNELGIASAIFVIFGSKNQVIVRKLICVILRPVKLFTSFWYLVCDSSW